MSLLWKVLTDDGHGATAGVPYVYPIPTAKKAGAWTEPVKKPSACAQGYHLTRRPGVWLPSAPTPFRLYLAEQRGAIDIHGDKVACESVRLTAEVTHEWPLLPMYPDIRALLMTAFRRREGPDAQWPDWANLGGADLGGAYLGGADLGGANLSGADLGGANLGRANLSGAYLGGAYLSRANLSGADLGGANLGGANLSGAYLGGANLPSWLTAEWTVDAHGYIVRVVAT